ncbi:SDR family NAD(P)-dependent oxidoreductase [Nocardiopsis salina]|uniref:SDR family NAD(P)-dependent oxidoreductase n=1 Tax=Nocardiopsis salina TaxID=245836 RepID=UPI0003478135|nr:SDR family NAD(P)-dependent oxidoreductase [Nocardiopsis salina]
MVSNSERTVVVTGANGVLGRALAGHLAATGYEVVGLDREAAATPEGVGVEACDITSTRQVVALLSDIADRGLSLYGLVNCAAVIPTAGLWEMDQDEFLHTVHVNTWGTLNMSREAARLMKESSEGRIVNISSVAGYIGGLVGGPDYAVSKAGVIVLTKVLAKELAPDNITVNAVAPGALAGPVTQNLTDEEREQVVGSIPLGRFGDTREIVASVSNLLADHSGYITGSTLDVNGGVYLR